MSLNIVVPISKIPEMIPEFERLGKKYGVQIPCYGHAGDVSLHAAPVKDPEMSMEAWGENEHQCQRQQHLLSVNFRVITSPLSYP
jgi:glycolate oxidase